MAKDIHGQAFWPGVVSVLSCTYTASHGITPGVAILEYLPQSSPIATQGTLRITDNYGVIDLVDCRVTQTLPQTDQSGQSIRMSIQDRRWKWGLGGIDGTYNQLDEHGKLLPWSIRSPEELARICLAAMGEFNFIIDLPPGLTEADGAAYAKQLVLGQNFPPTGTNPPVNWRNEVPAVALQRLVEEFGRRLVFCPISNKVLIVIIGNGANLPAGSVAKLEPKVQAPTVPSAVGVYGSDTVYQARMLLEPVGKEWHGGYVPINQLSYAPLSAGNQAEWRAWFDISSSSTCKVTVSRFNPTFLRMDKVDAQATAATGPAMADGLKSILEGKCVGKPIEVTLVSGSNMGRGFIDFTSVPTGPGFTVVVTVTAPLGTPKVEVVLRQTGSYAGPSWENSAPDGFAGVRATNRLNLGQARTLAKNSVWKTYRIVDPSYIDPNNPDVPSISVPGYDGDILRRQQIILTGEQVDQIVPDPGDTLLIDQKTKLPVLLNLYEGYSRSKPAVVYGSAYANASNLKGWYKERGADEQNTPVGKIFPADFSVDTLNQLITFNDYVFYFSGGKYLIPRLALVTGVNIRDAVTSQIDYFYLSLAVPGGDRSTNTLWFSHPDIQRNVNAAWDQTTGQVTNVEDLEADPIARAGFYLAYSVLQFPTKTGGTVEFNGIIQIDLDGAIQQVTWSIGDNGATTTASRDSEHNIWIPPFPARRRAENLDPSIGDQSRLIREKELLRPILRGGQ